eukprot:s1509_g13.t1
MSFQSASLAKDPLLATFKDVIIFSAFSPFMTGYHDRKKLFSDGTADAAQKEDSEDAICMSIDEDEKDEKEPEKDDDEKDEEDKEDDKEEEKEEEKVEKASEKEDVEMAEPEKLDDDEDLTSAIFSCWKVDDDDDEADKIEEPQKLGSDSDVDMEKGHVT